MARVHIGTSGWHYKHWCGPFYEERLPAWRMLGCYIQQFDTVELNNTFYRLPARTALESWYAQTPPSFCFAAKASRFLTHNKKLRDPENALNNLLPLLETLKEKLGPILFQLPPSWNVNAERLNQFLDALPARHQYAFEFRNATWNKAEICEILRCHRAAYCIYELAGFHSPYEITTDFAYVRLHGPAGKYQGSYSNEMLEEWAERIGEWQKSLRGIYVYFDNDQAGYAAQNALALKAMVEGRAERGRKLMFAPREGEAKKVRRA